jgi:hypothetical protein
VRVCVVTLRTVRFRPVASKLSAFASGSRPPRMLFTVLSSNAPGQVSFGLPGSGAPGESVCCQKTVSSTSFRPSRSFQWTVRPSAASRTATRYWCVVQCAEAPDQTTGWNCAGAKVGKSESVRDSASTIIASSLPLTLAVVVRMSRGAIGGAPVLACTPSATSRPWAGRPSRPLTRRPTVFDLLANRHVRAAAGADGHQHRPQHQRAAGDQPAAHHRRRGDDHRPDPQPSSR